MKKFLLLILGSILTLCTIPACSPTNSDPKPVFVVPTNYGKECLKNSTIKKAKREPIWKDGTRYLADNAYEMTIYSKADDKAHIEGTAYTDKDIDVQLFGIGTNKFNSPEAETVLYATTDENEANNNTTSESTSTDSNLITGVEYAYQTGPIRTELGSKQTLWLKTTIMEASDGYYVESENYQSTFTQVFITITDGIPPYELGSNPFEVSKEFILDNNSSEENLKLKLEEYLTEKVQEKYRGLYDSSRSDFDEKGATAANIRFENFDMNAESFTGLFDAVDDAGNKTVDQKFTINVIDSGEKNGLVIPNDLFDIGEFGYKKTKPEQIDSRVKESVFAYSENKGKDVDYSIEIIRESYKLYSDGIDTIRDIVKNRTYQEVRGNIYYKGSLLKSNVAIAKFILKDNVKPENKGTIVSNSVLDKEFENLKSNNYSDYINKGIDVIEKHVDIYDEIYENEYYYRIKVSTYNKFLYFYFYIIDKNKNENINYYVGNISLTTELEDAIGEELPITLYLTKDKQIINL